MSRRMYAKPRPISVIPTIMTTNHRFTPSPGRSQRQILPRWLPEAPFAFADGSGTVTWATIPEGDRGVNEGRPRGARRLSDAPRADPHAARRILFLAPSGSAGIIAPRSSPRAPMPPRGQTLAARKDPLDGRLSSDE